MAQSLKSLSSSPLLVRWLPFLAFLAVVLHYFWVLNNQAVNIPYQDDIYDFLEYIVLVEAAESSEQVLEELFQQYNDHRTSASRLAVHAAYLLEGEVNFRTLTFLGNLALPMILLLFSLSVRGEKYRWAFLLVSALLLLHPRTYTLILMSQAAFAYYYVFFYAFACLFALHQVTLPKLVLAAVMCTLSMFTFASGQMVWFLGLVSLLHQCLFSERKSFYYAAIWFLVAVIMLIVWHVGFIDLHSQMPAGTSSEEIRLLLPGYLGDASWHQAIARYVAFFLVILGSAFVTSSTLVAGTLGLAMTAALSFITVKFYRHQDIRLALCCWFIVASAAAVTLGRAMLFAPDYVLDTRYSFLSVMLLSTLVLLAQVRFAVFRSPAILLVVVLAVGYWNWAHSRFENPLQEMLNRRYSAFNRDRFPVVGKPLEESARIVREAVSEGIYHPPCRPYPACENPQ
tara:strand:- start:3554 stop:4918 length:1365 start_codon:yes stop_codon:yes gene_type:complete